MRLVVNLLTLLILLAVVIGEGYMWLVNPLHVPDGFPSVRAFGLRSFHERAPGMEPTLPVGKDVWITAWPYWHDSPQVGDIVAFVYPENPGLADVKRIAAVGGSTIVIRDGTVIVDGRELDEPYRRPGNSRLRPLTGVKVPPDSYYVLGDNRDISEDSRNYGSIPRSSIIGKLY